jgi:hypothetical protein
MVCSLRLVSATGFERIMMRFVSKVSPTTCLCLIN